MKDFKYLRLYDLYGALLTEHQRDLCELYYMCDLSLTEIAEQNQSSKQSVSDALSTSRALLDGYEEKLRLGELQGELSALKAGIAAFAAEHPEHADAMESIVKDARGATTVRAKD